MTSEVIVMNKNGIALAADSAATLFPQRQTFYSHNKIFSLSKNFPVGIMIHEKLRINGIPWETIIKMYRQAHNKCGFDRLEEYMEHIVSFLTNSNTIFNQDNRELYWVCDVLNYMERLGAEIEQAWHHTLRRMHHNHAGISLRRFGREFIQARIDYLRTCPDIPDFSENIRPHLKAALDTFDIGRLEKSFNLYPLAQLEWAQIKELISLLTLKNDFSLGHSVVVLAGFGEEDIFPVTVTARMGGYYFGTIKSEIEHAHKISSHNQAQIIPYASTDTVSSFLKGVHPNYEAFSLTETYTMIDRILNDFMQYLNFTPKPDDKRFIHDLTEEYFKTYKHRLTNHILHDHIEPVIESIRFVPKNNLATVAESLVHVTSFRTSVQPDTLPVGGEIDVALISKGDGFIWMKRKNYFDAAENQDYLNRNITLQR